MWSLNLQQETAAGEVREEVYRASLEATGHDVELLDTAIRSVVLFHRLLGQTDAQRARKERPQGLPVPITAIHRVQAPSWMMRLAWVPSSISHTTLKPSTKP